MPLMTLEDRITCIVSHAQSLRRAAAGAKMDDLRTMFESIELIAKEGKEIYTIEGENESTDRSGETTNPGSSAGS